MHYLLRPLLSCGHYSWLRIQVCSKLLNNANDVSWVIAAIISDALVLASSFSSCKFGWIKRDGNTVAHMLAKFASQSNLVVCNNELILQVVREAGWKDVMFSS
jgi:hypothetical protein